MKFTNQAMASKIKAASTMLETFLFYSGFFYATLYCLGNNKLANVAKSSSSLSVTSQSTGPIQVIKFQLGYNELPEDQQAELKMWVYELCMDLYQNEAKVHPVPLWSSRLDWKS